MTATAAERPPPPLSERLPAVRERLEDAPQLLVCLDFDGTLAPIVERPDEARPLPENEDAVAALAANPAVTTAVVSGRALADVRERIDGPNVYAGNHGLELARGDEVAVHPVARKRASTLAAVCSTPEVALESVPGVRIENKRLTGTVHLRSVPEPLRPVVRRRTRETVDRLAGDDLELSTGKCILEIEPTVPWGKGNAVELLEADVAPETTTVYVGDDTTDESAFRAVEPAGVGVRVGDDRSSAASCRVDSPREVASFLRWLADLPVGE